MRRLFLIHIQSFEPLLFLSLTALHYRRFCSPLPVRQIRKHQQEMATGIGSEDVVVDVRVSSRWVDAQVHNVDGNDSKQ